jgi:hypothetical protein
MIVGTSCRQPASVVLAMRMAWELRRVSDLLESSTDEPR